MYGFVKNDAIVLYDLLGKRCCGEHVLSAGQKCCMNKYPYTPKKQCCKNNMLYNSDFLTCLTNCIERHSLSNLLGGLLAANSTINGLFSKPYKTGTTGKSTGWLSKLGEKIKVTMPFRFMNTNNLLRAIGRLGVAILVADGFYTLGLFLSCSAICADDPCSF